MSLTQFNTRPLYQQVADEFISRIVNGTWVSGQSIDNEADLSRALGISLGTVRKAFDILVEAKLIERQQGKGTIVADLNGPRMRARMTSIRDLAGKVVDDVVDISKVEIVEPHEVANQLQLQIRATVLRFERRRSYQGRLYMIEDVYLPVDATVAKLPKAKLAVAATDLWKGTDLATDRTEQVSARIASDADRKAFDVKDDLAILRIERVVLSYQGKPLELSRARCHLGSDLVYVSR